MRTLRIGLCQINTIVGDIEGNTRKILGYIAKGKRMGADLLAFPEMAVTGYPPEDLLLMPKFIEANLKAVKTIAKATSSITVVVGFVNKDGDIFNSAALLHDGKLIDVYSKIYLPNYGVFDEDRYFQRGKENFIFTLKSTPIGLSICEDLWYPGDPIRTQTLYGGAELIVNISSSPYHAGKCAFREKMISTRASDNAAIVAYCNLVGGQDELVFDGGSLIFDQRGELMVRGRQFEEDLILSDLDMEAVFRMRLHDPRIRRERFSEEEKGLRKIELTNQTHSIRKKPSIPKRDSKPLDRLSEIYTALVLGTGDYIRKNGFKQVLIGLSGGIDSALTAAVAVDALGKKGVIGVAMPSQYSSKGSIEDTELLAKNLGIRLLKIPITEIFRAYLKTLSSSFRGLKPNVTEENIQARIRGNILMALSNKFGWLVLTTGNKSEMSVGYCTLYGDMAGGYAVLKDVPKTLVYELTELRNKKEGKAIIPKNIFIKPPSAELRPNQKDEDSLPPYPVLDPILQAYVEEDKEVRDITKMGFKENMIKEVINMVDRNEYKRRQSPPGIKITHRALGKDRRLPVTNKYRNF
ncbi:MAG: NAD+ synthase [Deltaproteobacteria bacterium CG_4_8_14_3_um_filter_45_9]|nr:MAG: NAD+ synthase [Deltaproteobacteria bacterium CG_4_8_14_3_um_filter_45_9]